MKLPLSRRERSLRAWAVLALGLCIPAWAGAMLPPPVFDSVSSDARGEALRFDAPGIDAEGVRVQVLLPPGYDAQSSPGYPVLYLNDGQDADAVALRSRLDAMIASGEIRPVIAVAIAMPKDRIAAYGFSDRRAGRSRIADSRVGAVGTNAHAYSEWVAKTLVPAIDARYRTQARPDARAILGWSLGGANALNLGWQYPEIFGRTGAFSPSFWLSTEKSSADKSLTDKSKRQPTRIAQQMIAAGDYHPGAKFFFAVGEAEETDDRDGLIDVLDDARDLILGERDAKGAVRRKGLQQLGHGANIDDEHPKAAASEESFALTRHDVSLFVLRAGEHNQTSWSRMLPVFLRWAYAVHAPALNATGATESWQALASRHVAARNVDVWLPPSYGREPQRRYPVLYMHDGQNLFDPALSYTGVDWDIDGAMTRLIERGEVREAIVVGIWNTPWRWPEYMPRAPVRGRRVDGLSADEIRSDDYLRFLVEELKPFIDARYRTLPGRGDTFVMGSSMGGLISLYAAARYPDVFGGVGAVSTHWSACDGCTADWFGQHLPDPGTHRLYFDHGTKTLDAKYPPYQRKMDDAMRAGGYREGENWITRSFEGAEHNETAWRARIDVPLRFLLGKP